MRYVIYLLGLIIFSCQNHKQAESVADTTHAVEVITPPGEQINSNKETCWTGTLNGKIPVFVHFRSDTNNILVGEIVYLNTKNKLPITLLGTMEGDKSYRLMEFEDSGNITGVITGTLEGDVFKGNWYGTKNTKEFSLSLVKKDTVIDSPAITTTPDDVFGHYHYQYSEAGYQGDLEISKLPDSKAVFGITSVTREPARNIANIDDDTITLNNTYFVYTMPETEDCAFSVTFYKRFAYVQYTKGYCAGQFGMNATIDGIFLKTK